MPGIGQNTTTELQYRISAFSAAYANDWQSWLETSSTERPAAFGSILRKWQACRPNRMRRERAAENHAAPYLEDIILECSPHVIALQTFDIADPIALEKSEFNEALRKLWAILEHLSYGSAARNGLAGSVGISKAVMLLTNGRVGPAFDSEVRNALGLRTIETADQWLTALLAVNNDIQLYEQMQKISFNASKPTAFSDLHNGRLYDMALGPR